MIYWQDKTHRYTDRQTACQIDRKNDRHTGRLTRLNAKNFNVVGLIRIALIENDEDY